MKLLVAIIVLFSLVFLFGGMFSVGIFGNHSVKNNTAKIKQVTIVNSQPVTNHYSMKQIDSITAAYNYPFTSANGKGSSVYAVAK